MKSLLAMSCLILVTTASPAPSLTGPMLSKRSNPVIGPDLDKQFGDNTKRVQAQLKDAFQDACSLAKAARDTVDINNKIYQRYFPKNENIARNVKEIFLNIIGDDKSPGLQKKFEGVPKDTPKDKLQKDEPCADILKKITIVPDFVGGRENRTACAADDKDKDNVASTMAETRDANKDDENDAEEPKIIVCNPGVAHGGIDQAFKTDESTRGGTLAVGPDAVTCKSVSDDGDRTTWRMEVLGSVVLHEYMHWADLTVTPKGPLGDDMSDGEEPDFIYGPVMTQQRPKDGLTETFPDIYTWFALEAFWSDKCKKEYALADEDKKDDEDPLCDKDTCKDPGSNPPEPAT